MRRGSGRRDSSPCHVGIVKSMRTGHSHLRVADNKRTGPKATKAPPGCSGRSRRSSLCGILHQGFEALASLRPPPLSWREVFTYSSSILGNDGDAHHVRIVREVDVEKPPLANLRCWWLHAVEDLHPHDMRVAQAALCLNFDLE